MKRLTTIPILFSLALCACAPQKEYDLSGRWIEQLPEDAPYTQGFELKDDGRAESIGMHTLLYHRWSVSGDELILAGESLGNGLTLDFEDTLKIVSISGDTLRLKRHQMEITYVREPYISGQEYTLEGELVIGHEVRSFTPKGCKEDYWIIDRSGTLEQMYDEAAGGVKSGKSVNATIRLEYLGKQQDGFAADYPGAFLVKEIVDMKPLP